MHSGDKNSKYFHASASVRRRTNHIHKLKNGEGDWVDWDNGLAEHITQHFSYLFTPAQSNCHDVVDCIEKLVKEEQNADLLRNVTEEEVKHAFFK